MTRLLPLTAHLVLLALMPAIGHAAELTAADIDRLPASAQLPDPFLRADGSRVATVQDWPAQRRHLATLIQTACYGTLPPAGGPVTASEGATTRDATTQVTERELALSMGPHGTVHTRLLLTLPPGTGPFPVVIDGDLCWGRVAPAIAAEVLRRGYALAQFDRAMIAADPLIPLPKAITAAGETLAHHFPNCDAGAVACWAWGFHRVVDYLLTQPVIDRARIIVTGHSRGAKAVLLAGALDERIALVAPNNSGCLGAGCVRFAYDGEPLESITRLFPQWFAPQAALFVDHLDRLPFDSHTLKALVAPRPLLSTEGLDDHWSNPRGTQITFQAAREVYAFLGARDHIGIAFRPGGHKHDLVDFQALLDFADRELRGKPTTRSFDTLAFAAATEAFFTWKRPGVR